ncbi:DNA alkylation repair protein [Microbacterium rhizomatis]|uniref:DNA alkylation repair protein n=1 Tax=Microbacterium rhizomatis TaxID=1631477 RepID=A0A5J5J6D0_9MICO|nr:DNA alkylation repair protein [Microbacterium rhizomatis]KAA9110535.1 DNA alkylation repair protein [Microbacterium rhizomatis]
MSALADSIRTSLRHASDPARAPAQQAYMKSAMPYLGVSVPLARRIARTAARSVPDADAILTAVRELWDVAAASEPHYREERYAAMALLAIPAMRDDPRMLATIEHMVRTGRWWDYTDELAHRVADELDERPEATAAIVRRWASDDDLWMRRIAIIAQLGRKDRVDRMLLADVLAPNLDDPEFFIRKAIGWALRDLARADPEWVRGYAQEHALSPLSRREALKHLGS